MFLPRTSFQSPIITLLCTILIARVLEKRFLDLVSITDNDDRFKSFLSEQTSGEAS
jgi:hypothetical protein